MLTRFSHVQLFAALWTVAHQAPLSLGFSRQEYWGGWPCPPLRDLPDPGVEPASLRSPSLAGGFFTTSTTWSPCPHTRLGRGSHCCAHKPSPHPRLPARILTTSFPEPPCFPVHRSLWPRQGPWFQLSLYLPLPSACPLTQRLTRAIQRHGGGAAWNCLSG